MKKNVRKLLGLIVASSLLVGCMPTVLASGVEETGLVTAATYAEVNKLLIEHPETETYINDVIDAYMQAEDVSNINQDILNAVEGVRECYKTAEKIYVQENIERNVSLLSEVTQAEYLAAKTLYLDGIGIVRLAGCKQTAKYMEHAIVPYNSTTEPSSYYSDNDEWAEEVCNSDTLFCQVTEQFETEILGAGLSNGSVDGSVSFNVDDDGLDLVAALHSVAYTVSFVKQSNGYSVQYYVMDKYDFAWNDYENFALDFANNYCYYMQSIGGIRPFNIYITYSA